MAHVFTIFLNKKYENLYLGTFNVETNRMFVQKHMFLDAKTQ